MRARKVPREALAGLRDADWVDRSRRPYVRDGVAWVPVRDGYPADDDLPERVLYAGRGYHLIGDIAVLHGPAPTEADLAAIIEHCRPRGVMRVAALAGEKRVPEAEVLYGTVGETVHREQGYAFHLNPATVMFSQGNRDEKVRMATLAQPGERVADMFAGIGYFTIPAACSGATVHAMELNRAAFEYLKRNIIENHVEDRVRAQLGDCRDLLSGCYDRVIMGHFDAPDFLPAALTHVRTGSVLHVHSIGPAETEIRRHLRDAGLSGTIAVHRVKKYAPRAWHMVQDVTIS
jgi:tRNA wybutosine-synthesizing protein 2